MVITGSKWVYQGPFTVLFIRFLGSNIQITSKVTVIAYISTCKYAAVPLWAFPNTSRLRDRSRYVPQLGQLLCSRPISK